MNIQSISLLVVVFLGGDTIEHVNTIPTMQFFHWNFKKYSVKIICAYVLSLTECVWNFQNNALWALFNMPNLALTLNVSFTKDLLHLIKKTSSA